MQAIPGEFLEIDRKERANTPYRDLSLRPAVERVCDFDEVVIGFDPERAKLEAARCVHCPDPAPCMLACPTNNDIPSAMWLIEEGRFLEAASLYHQTSSLPEVCGRVCPTNNYARGLACSTGMGSRYSPANWRSSPSITNEQISRALIRPVQPTGRRVAIVGAGPAGLACADLLLESGHAVTIFNSKPAPGGLLVYGIPNFKLPKEVVSGRWQDLLDAGVRLHPEHLYWKDKNGRSAVRRGFRCGFPRCRDRDRCKDGGYAGD